MKTTFDTDAILFALLNSSPVTDSLKVAQVFEKRHDNVLKAIRNICRPQNIGEQTKWFYESNYIDANGLSRPMFVMNRDGFSLLAMGLIRITQIFNRWLSNTGNIKTISPLFYLFNNYNQYR